MVFWGVGICHNHSVLKGFRLWAFGMITLSFEVLCFWFFWFQCFPESLGLVGLILKNYGFGVLDFNLFYQGV